MLIVMYKVGEVGVGLERVRRFFGRVVLNFVRFYGVLWF